MFAGSWEVAPLAHLLVDFVDSDVQKLRSVLSWISCSQSITNRYLLRQALRLFGLATVDSHELLEFLEGHPRPPRLAIQSDHFHAVLVSSIIINSRRIKVEAKILLEWIKWLSESSQVSGESCPIEVVVVLSQTRNILESSVSEVYVTQNILADLSDFPEEPHDMDVAEHSDDLRDDISVILIPGTPSPERVDVDLETPNQEDDDVIVVNRTVPPKPIDSFIIID